MTASLPILTFHALDDLASVISVPPRVFQRGMAKLHAHGYQTLRLQEAVACLQRGEPFPERSLVLTFDDGYQSVYTKAFPVLQRYGMLATVFLTVGAQEAPGSARRLPPLEGRAMLSWREIREMQRWGVVFGAHTLTHPDLTRLSTHQIITEVRDSKARIEDALAVQVLCFAYPFGHYDRRSRDIVQQYFACACSDRLGILTPGSDLYALERIDMYYFRTDRLFDVLLTGLFPYYVKARGIPRRIRRAVQRRII
jgi:peptidoglycan/xylan/chitin deacetylase (PgdA/CDA1 family)